MDTVLLQQLALLFDVMLAPGMKLVLSAEGSMGAYNSSCAIACVPLMQPSTQ
jgi:hypothetical protein